MGVVNVTPDSFFDGGRFVDADAAVAHGMQLVADGADIVDVGGESSRPGAEPVAIEEELRRVLPVVARLADEGVVVSIDTYRAETARRCVEAGAAMINDITALSGDDDMADVVAVSGCDVVLMHMLGTPQTMQENPVYGDVVLDICGFFDERIARAKSQGIDERRIWIDPGFGFGKTVEHNLELIRRLREFTRFGRPVLIGTSNKSTIGKVLGTGSDERMEGTAATVAVAIQNGADAVRVHDVRMMSRVARMTDAIVGGYS